MKLISLVTIAHSIKHFDSGCNPILFWISAAVWVGIVCYLVLLHIRVKQLEKRLHEKK